MPGCNATDAAWWRATGVACASAVPEPAGVRTRIVPLDDNPRPPPEDGIATRKGSKGKPDTLPAAERLERLRAEAKRERATAQRRERTRESRKKGRQWASPSALRETGWLAVRLAVPVLLPFVTLVGGSAWGYRLLGLPTYTALFVAVVLTAVCLTAIGLRLAKAISRHYHIRRIGWKLGMRLALPIVAIYCGYALLYLARENAKTDAVQSYFTSVHPILRIALGTAILADPAIVITETGRVPADYRGMGLPPLENSMHFRQRDGYVHAVDLRTGGRSWIRNLATRAYFTLLGFKTLRHVGSADHLHVSLPLR